MTARHDGAPCQYAMPVCDAGAGYYRFRRLLRSESAPKSCATALPAPSQHTTKALGGITYAQLSADTACA